jgi:hypothetical protein
MKCEPKDRIFGLIVGFLFGLLEMIEFFEEYISTLSTRLYEMVVSSVRNELSAES